jgi:porin
MESVRPLEQEVSGTFGGPDSVPKRMELDRATSDSLFELSLMRPYYDWKDHVREKYGYSFGMAYISTYVKATDSLRGTDDYAAGGVFRHFGAWELLGRGTETTGTLKYLVEYRNRYTDTAPSPFSIENLGNIGAIEIPFASDGWHLTNLYWDQTWDNGNLELVVGYLDVTDFVDVYGLTSPWTDFYNFAFSIGAGTMDLPDDASLGVAAGAWLTDHVYLIGGFEDLNSDPTDPLDGFDTFFSDREFFKHLEVGWAASKEQYYVDNIHLTLWHADDREELDVDDGWGAMFSLSRSLGEKWLVFARGGFADDGGSLLHKSVSAGFGYQPHASGLGTGDQLAVGFHWGDPNDDLFGAGLDDQYAIESYYRWQLTKELAITPDVQLLINPALNPERETLWVFGLRMRFAF